VGTGPFPLFWSKFAATPGEEPATGEKERSMGKKHMADRDTTEPVTADPRLSIIQADPRFARPKRKDVKIPLDSRFKAAFKDKEFIDQRIIHGLHALIYSKCG
jgi:hypothetical protein